MRYEAVLVFAICTAALLSEQKSEAYKILFMPLGNKSHLIEFHGLGRVLLNRGHEVHIYLSKVDTPPSEVAEAGYKFIHPDTDQSLMPMAFTDEEVIASVNKPFLVEMWSKSARLREFRENVKRIAEIVASDQKSFEEIRKERFDYAVVDNVMFSYYLFIVPHKLGIPYGGLTTMHEAVMNRVPFFPSVFGDISFGHVFGSDPGLLGSSMWHRLKNLLAIAFHENFMISWVDEVFEKANVKMDDILRKITLHLVDQHYLLSDAMPTTSNVRHIGGLVTKPAKPITDEKLLNFLDASDLPVIVCSFGSMMGSLTPELIEKLMNAFRKVPQYRIVMRLKGSRPQNVPDNVHLMSWMPQNDLLGHNKTALLITHSGNNGQNEALYHGVPMVAFFVFGDQMFNADRVVRHDYGVKLNLALFKEHELVDSINEVMTNDKYRKSIRKASEISREENAGEKAAELIEHVIKFGADHMIPKEAFEMSLVQFTMLDIVFIFFSTLTVLFFVILTISVKLIKRCFN